MKYFIFSLLLLGSCATVHEKEPLSHVENRCPVVCYKKGLTWTGAVHVESESLICICY